MRVVLSILDWSCSPGSVKGPEIINMYVGQSEENIREGTQSLSRDLT